MKKYTSPINTIRHIMLKYGGGVVPATRTREGGDVKPIEKKKVKKTEVISKESYESRVDSIRNTIEEGSMGLKRLERLSAARVALDPARVKHKVAQAKAHESNPDKYQGNIDQNEKMTQHMGDQYARAEHLMPGDVDHYPGQVMRAELLKGTPKGETRHYRETETGEFKDVTTSVNFRNSMGAVPHAEAQGNFTAHPDAQLASRTSLSSSVPPAVAHHGMFTHVDDPQGKNPHMAARIAYGGPHHPEGGPERNIENIMISVANFKKNHSLGLPRGVSLTSGGVSNEFLNHAVGDNEHPVGLHRK